MGVCAWARVSAAPRHSWLGCWDVCVLVCALRLYPATPGWGVRCGCVCLGSGFVCATPLRAGVLGCVCACVCAPLVPRHSWLGCWVVCVLELGFWLRPATPGWGVGVCVFVCLLRLYHATPGSGVRCGRLCLGLGFSCAPPFQAGVCGVGVCAWASVGAAPRHSWLGGWLVCVLVCALRLYPATSGSGVRCGCVCLGSGFGCGPPLLAGMCGVGVCAWAGVFGFGPPLLVGVLGLFVCSARFACTPPLLAGMCGVGVCAWARVLAAPRHSWLGCWGVRVCVHARLVPRHS